MRSEIEKLRAKYEQIQQECSRLRIEAGRKREEEKAAAKQQDQQVLQSALHNSVNQNKRELLDEIEKKNNEMVLIMTELKVKQSMIEEYKKSVDELQRSKEDLANRLKSQEKELSILRTAPSMNMANEPFNHTSPAPLGGLLSLGHNPVSSRPSSSNAYFSQGGGGGGSIQQSILIQKDQEISDLKILLEDMQHQLEEKTGKVQQLIRMIADNETGNEKRLERRLEQKDSEIS